MRPCTHLTVPLRFRYELPGGAIEGHHLKVRESIPRLLQTVSRRCPPLNRAHNSACVSDYEATSGMSKRVILISIIAVPIFLGIFSCGTWFAAFLAAKYLAGRTDGKQGIARSLIIPWRDYQIHLHHWLVALIVGGILAAKGFYLVTPEGFYGVVSAVVFQGIYCYKDWYRIIKRRNILPTSTPPISLVAETDNVIAESRALVTVPAS
jgi:hypothetical protein